jgi:nicotinate phosphoribosyltransferase
MTRKGLLWQKDAPIIRRVDENDVYKILMMYLIWKYYPNLQVSFGFKNRTVDVPLAQYIDMGELAEQIGETATLRFTDKVIGIYRSWDMFPEDFLQYLKGLQLNQPTISIQNGILSIETCGNWLEDTLWEIYILAIVSELASRGRAKHDGLTEAALWREGNERLSEKIALFNAHPDLRIAQFGLRRRFSGLWEDHVTNRLVTECRGVITGVSNMYLADKYKLPAQGTNAHELPMALTALARHTSDQAMRDAPYVVLKLWQKLFGYKSLIMLDDAYGSDVFHKHLQRKYLEDFKGFRHDSGDPFAYGEAVIALYNSHGIDPRNKLIIFSDGLNPRKAIALMEHFRGRIMVAFGMGTNLTNDFTSLKALSLVMKIMSAAGNPAVKLSNNLNKATGPTDEIEYYMKVFGYTNTASETVVY